MTLASSHLFRNQKLSVQSILEKCHGENWVHPSCPVPLILQGPTGCGKSLTTCHVAVNLGVDVLVVIGPCVARQAWEQAFDKTFSHVKTDTKMLFLSTGLLVKRYPTSDNAMRNTLAEREDIPARVINTMTAARGRIYGSKREQQRSQYAYLNQTKPNDLKSDDLFMSLPWHDKRILGFPIEGGMSSSDTSRGDQKRVRLGEDGAYRTKSSGSGRWMLALDESHVTCGKSGWTLKNSILSTICATLRAQKGYLLLISATPISTEKERTAHIKFMGYAHYYNFGTYRSVHSTLRELIVPKLSEEQRISIGDRTTEEVCWKDLLCDHHCVLQGDAPKMTILDIEARFYQVHEPLYSELRECTSAMREVIKQRTFTDRYGEEKVRLDEKGYKNVTEMMQKLETLKVPLVARIIIETIESEYHSYHSFVSDYGEDDDDEENEGEWICPKAIVYVNAPKTAAAVYDIVNQYFMDKTKTKQSKLQSKLAQSRKKVLKPEIKGILAKSSIPDKRRVKVIDQFNEASDVRYFIGTYSSYAPSINLQDKSGKHPRYTFLVPTTRFTNLDQAAGRTWRPKAGSDSYVRMVFVEGLEEELTLLDRLCRRKAMQDKHDLGKIQRPPLPGEYTMRLDRTGEEIEFSAFKFNTNDATAKMRRDEHDRRKNTVCLMRNLWTIYYKEYDCKENEKELLLHNLSEEMMELVLSYVIH